MLVKSLESYELFRAGRRVESALHREDGLSGEVIGWVDDDARRPTDTEIDRAAYEAYAVEIRVHNAAIPAAREQSPRRDRLVRIAAIRDQGVGNQSPEEFRELVNLLAAEAAR